MERQQNLLKKYKYFLSLVLINLVKSCVLIYLPRFVIETLGEKTFTTYIVFNNYFEIIFILSFVSLNRILLKNDSYRKFLLNYKKYFNVNLILYLFFTIIFYKIDHILLILLFINSLFLLYNFIKLNLIYKKNILETILYEVIYILSLFLILYLIKILNFQNEYSLIVAYILSIFIIIIINFKIIKLLFYKNIFNFKYFFITLKTIFRENILYYDLLKKSYFPLLLFFILTLYTGRIDLIQIITIIGIVSALFFFPGNLIAKTSGLIEINNNLVKKDNFFSFFLSISGIIFFLSLYLFGFDYISNFYFQNNNLVFKFIFLIFIIFGCFHYLSEIYVPAAIKSNKTKFLSYTFFVAILSLMIFFIIANFYNLAFERFITLVVISYALCQSIIIYKLNIK
jgi:hypothetical protein